MTLAGGGDHRHESVGHVQVQAGMAPAKGAVSRRVRQPHRRGAGLLPQPGKIKARSLPAWTDLPDGEAEGECLRRRSGVRLRVRSDEGPRMGENPADQVTADVPGLVLLSQGDQD